VTPPTTHREVEQKLSVHALFELPDLEDEVEQVSAIHVGEPIELTAVYHDTEDLRLIRWGVTLRRREGGADEGWHLKLPVEGRGHGVRDEVRLPLDRGEVGHVPDEIADLVTALVRDAPLVPVVRLRTERHPFLVVDADGRECAELVDDTVEVFEGDRVAAVFREIEVEALDATADMTALEAVVDALMEHGAVPGTASKAASALGPRVADPPDVPAAQWPGPDGTGAEAVHALLATHVRRLLLQDVRLRRDLPDSVHQMRVAARRMRSGLRVFTPLVEKDWADRLRAELGWIAGELGTARDTEVLLDRLDDHARALEPADRDLVLTAVDPWLHARLDQARADSLHDLRSDRYRQLLVDLVDAVQNPRLTALAQRPASEVLPPLVEKAFRRLAKDVTTLSLAGPSEDWHRSRIHAKRARYAADAVAPIFGERARALSEHLERVTELLGEHQDAFVAQQIVRELSAHPDVDGATGFALGLLHSFEVEQELLDRVRFEEVWPQVVAAHDANRLVPGRSKRHGSGGRKSAKRGRKSTKQRGKG
jgi:CHAD domain-containing protein